MLPELQLAHLLRNHIHRICHALSTTVPDITFLVMFVDAQLLQASEKILEFFAEDDESINLNVETTYALKNFQK